jgi:hypothetical protein
MTIDANVAEENPRRDWICSLREFIFWLALALALDLLCPALAMRSGVGLIQAQTKKSGTRTDKHGIADIRLKELVFVVMPKFQHLRSQQSLFPSSTS